MLWKASWEMCSWRDSSTDVAFLLRDWRSACDARIRGPMRGHSVLATCWAEWSGFSPWVMKGIEVHSESSWKTIEAKKEPLIFFSYFMYVFKMMDRQFRRATKRGQDPSEMDPQKSIRLENYLWLCSRLVGADANTLPDQSNSHIMAPTSMTSSLLLCLHVQWNCSIFAEQKGACSLGQFGLEMETGPCSSLYFDIWPQV